MITDVPALTPVTRPVLLMVATPVDAEDVIAQATAEEVEALGTDELIMGTEPPEGEAIVDLADAKSKDDFEVLEEAQLQKEIESEEV